MDPLRSSKTNIASKWPSEAGYVRAQADQEDRLSITVISLDTLSHCELMHSNIYFVNLYILSRSAESSL